MNYLTERLRLLGKGLANWDKVLEGRLNAVKQGMGQLSPEVETEADRRLTDPDIGCLNCPFNSLLAPESGEYYSLTGEHYQTTREEPHCSICGCPLEYKVLSMASNCGLETWNAHHPENPQPIRWTAYPPPAPEPTLPPIIITFPDV